MRGSELPGRHFSDGNTDGVDVSYKLAKIVGDGEPEISDSLRKSRQGVGEDKSARKKAERNRKTYVMAIIHATQASKRAFYLHSTAPAVSVTVSSSTGSSCVAVKMK